MSTGAEPRGDSDPDLRILILSTPKTGNTWLRHLLAGVYRLPRYYVPPPIDSATLDQAGKRWVTHYHCLPDPELLSWIRANGAAVVTTIRHPGDVLISLYHHVHNFRGGTPDHDFMRRMIFTGFERRGITTYAADRPFSADLECSLEWMASTGTHTVRYEDLRADPVAALRELTSRICPAPLERIEAAVEMCDIDVMRGMAGDFSGFFREGRVGGWRELLPPDIVEAFRSQAPYAAQMARLGYSVDPVDSAAPVRAPLRRHPLRQLRQFDNGAALAPIVIQCFFWARYEQRSGWERQLAATGPGSFYNWLNSPAPEAGRGFYETLPLSNIALFVHDQRADVGPVYKDLSSSARREYVHWFLRHAQQELGLDAAFVNRQREYVAAWTSRHPILTLERFADGTAVAPILVDCFSRAPYEQYEAWERQPAATGPGSFFDWLNSPSPVAGRGFYESLRLSNIAAYVYERRPDVQLVYKDLSSADRYEYVRWFLGHAQREHGLDAEFVNRQRAYLLQWANASAAAGGERTSNFVLHICQCRIDMMAAFPHITGADRRALVRAVVRTAKALQMDAGYIRPLEESLGRHWLPERVRRWCGLCD